MCAVKKTRFHNFTILFSDIFVQKQDYFEMASLQTLTAGFKLNGPIGPPLENESVCGPSP